METIYKVVKYFVKTETVKGIWDCLSGRAEIIHWKKSRERYRRYEDNNGNAVYRLTKDRRKWEFTLHDCYCAHCFEIGKIKKMKSDGNVMLSNGGCEYQLTCHSCETEHIYYFSD